MELKVYNTASRRKEVFKPLDPAQVRMYVCGPTVYDFAHIGNARPVVVFDVLFRLLRHLYGEAHVKYVRNITDVDDKINARAAAEGVPIRTLTERTAAQFHEDIAALGVLPPTVEPRATESIPEMIAMIERLIAAGHAYAADGHVLYDVASKPDYGKLARRSLDEMIAGARVEVAPYKKNPMDFVLWKPSPAPEAQNKKGADLPGWDSPWGRGRPGWHIECSAMSERHLGQSFDIHGGGIDLVFPHHENEIAQSEGAHGGKPLASIWMHNGFLQVEGEKMAKSRGNFVTIHELLRERTFGSQPWHGKVLRCAMLQTHYRQPIDWTIDRLVKARSMLCDWADIAFDAPSDEAPPQEFVEALADDLNTPAAFTILHDYAKAARRPSVEDVRKFKAAARLIGVYDNERSSDFSIGYEVTMPPEVIKQLISERTAARKAKNFSEADRIRQLFEANGYDLRDHPNGTTTAELKR